MLRMSGKLAVDAAKLAADALAGVRFPGVAETVQKLRQEPSILGNFAAIAGFAILGQRQEQVRRSVMAPK